MKSYDIIIFGSGISGLSAAAAFAAQNYNTALIEKSSLADNLKLMEQRSFAISAGSKKFLEEQNLWQLFAGSEFSPIEKIHVIDGYGEPDLIFDHQMLGNAALGYMVTAKDLKKNLSKLIKEQKLKLDLYENFDCADLVINPDDVTIKSSSGKKLSAKLLLAFDGRNSFIRKKLDITTKFHDYQQTALTATISHTNDHQNIAVERFLPAGPFALLPLKGGKKTSIVWVEDSLYAEKLLKAKRAKLEEHLAEKTAQYADSPKLTEDLQAFPLNLVKAPQNIFKRIILMGDTAHGIHPLAGQGFNLTIRDIKTLLEIMTEQKLVTELDIGSSKILGEFMRRRKFDINSLIFVTHGLNSLFACDNKFLKLLRKTGMKAIDKLPPLKKFLMKQAAGKAN